MSSLVARCPSALRACLSPLVVSSLVLTSVACGPATPEPSSGSYETYECPAPIGKIVRDSCDRYAIQYDGMQVEGGVDVGPLGGARGMYVDKATREADIMIQVLKEQRVGLCHSFNTCKMTREEYRREQQRIDDTSSVLLAMRERLPGASADEARELLGRLSTMRTDPNTNPAGPEVAPPKPPAPPAGDAPAAASEGPAWNPGVYMAQALETATSYGLRLASKGNFGFDTGSACLVGGFLERGKTLKLSRAFRGGVQYVVLGGGSSGTQDLDIAIVDAQGKVVVADVDKDANPVVDLKVAQDGVYDVVVKLQQASSDGEFVALAMLHEGGYSVPSNRFVSSMTGVLQVGGRIARRGPPVVFHAQNEWSFYGIVLQPRQIWTSPATSFQASPSFAVGLADDVNNDIDLGIKSAGAIVAKDVEKDGNPIVQFAPPSGPVNVVVENPGAAAAFISVILLDAERQTTTL